MQRGGTPSAFDRILVSKPKILIHDTSHSATTFWLFIWGWGGSLADKLDKSSYYIALTVWIAQIQNSEAFCAKESILRLNSKSSRTIVHT